MKTCKKVFAKSYTANHLTARICPSGVYRSDNKGHSGYWVVSKIALFHYNPQTGMINTVGGVSGLGEKYYQIPHTAIIFDIQFPTQEIDHES